DVAGQIEAVGAQATQFQRGDEVYADLSGIGFGGLAEYVAVQEHLVALKPTTMSFEEAASVPLAGITALQCLRDVAKLQAGEADLINGASGGVGSFAVQIAKAFGAEVSAVVSTNKVAMLKQLGAYH